MKGAFAMNIRNSVIIVAVIVILVVSGVYFYQEKLQIDEKNHVIMDKNTTYISIYDPFESNYIAAITIKNQEEIKQLEDLFNNAEFIECDEKPQAPALLAIFAEENGSTSVFIYSNNVIAFNDRCFRSKQITFDKINSIYSKYLNEKNSFKIDNATSIDIDELVNVGSSKKGKHVTIKNQEEIKQLEDLFNNAKITKCDEKPEVPALSIKFNCKDSLKLFTIYANGVITQPSNKSYSKSEQITFDKIKKYLDNKK